MSEGPFFINYSKSAEHFILGPYKTRRFAMVHLEEIKAVPGVNNVWLGNKPPTDVSKCYRRHLPITRQEMARK